MVIFAVNHGGGVGKERFSDGGEREAVGDVERNKMRDIYGEIEEEFGER